MKFTERACNTGLKAAEALFCASKNIFVRDSHISASEGQSLCNTLK
jgi:hypothetical protein